ncbi:MAG TPA: hypothetical protein VF707_01530, partial [Ardenticatenaceae bacterium]
NAAQGELRGALNDASATAERIRAFTNDLAEAISALGQTQPTYQAPAASTDEGEQATGEAGDEPPNNGNGGDTPEHQDENHGEYA